ncbi:MAG: spore germination protein GerW family protein [Chloroflexota bacterium]
MNINEVVNTSAIEKFVEQIGVNKVFGPPTHEGDTTIIPVAQVQFGFGFGGGMGSSPNGHDPDNLDETLPEKANAGEDASIQDGEGLSQGGGGGGGAGGRSTPRGYIHISPAGVKYTPIMDETRIPLGGMLVGAWSIFWIMLTIRAVVKAVVTSRQKVLLAKKESAS